MLGACLLQGADREIMLSAAVVLFGHEVGNIGFWDSSPLQLHVLGHLWLGVPVFTAELVQMLSKQRMVQIIEVA